MASRRARLKVKPNLASRPKSGVSVANCEQENTNTSKCVPLEKEEDATEVRNMTNNETEELEMEDKIAKADHLTDHFPTTDNTLIHESLKTDSECVESANLDLSKKSVPGRRRMIKPKVQICGRRSKTDTPSKVVSEEKSANADTTSEAVVVIQRKMSTSDDVITVTSEQAPSLQNSSTNKNEFGKKNLTDKNTDMYSTKKDEKMMNEVKDIDQREIDLNRLTPRRRLSKVIPNLSSTRKRHISQSFSDGVDGGVMSPGPMNSHESLVSPEPISSAPSTPMLGKGSQENKISKAKRTVRRTKVLQGPVDRSKLTMRDIIYMNPTSNPMKTKEDEQARDISQSNEEEVVGTQQDEQTSLGSPTPANSPPGGDDAALPPQESASVAADDEEDEETMPVPQVTIGPDGEIIIKESSLTLAAPKVKPIDDEFMLSKYKASEDKIGYGKRTYAKQWPRKETKKFYMALSSIGTDFSLMTSLFPNRTRTELKRKFKREDKLNRALVDHALKDRRDFDMALFDNLTSSDSEPEDETPSGKKIKKQKTAKDVAEGAEGEAKDKKTKAKRKLKRKKSNDREASNEENEDQTDKKSKKNLKRSRKLVNGEETENADITESTTEKTSLSCMPLENLEEGPNIKITKRKRAVIVSSDEEDTSVTVPSKSGEMTNEAASGDYISKELAGTASTSAPQPLCMMSPPAGSQPSLFSSLQMNAPRGLMSPPPPGVTPPAGKFVSLSSLNPAAVANLNVKEMQPGQLVFVTSNPTAEQVPTPDGKPQKVIHVYMVSPAAGQDEQAVVSAGSGPNTPITVGHEGASFPGDEAQTPTAEHTGKLTAPEAATKANIEDKINEDKDKRDVTKDDTSVENKTSRKVELNCNEKKVTKSKQVVKETGETCMQGDSALDLTVKKRNSENVRKTPVMFSPTPDGMRSPTCSSGRSTPLDVRMQSPVNRSAQKLTRVRSKRTVSGPITGNSRERSSECQGSVLNSSMEKVNSQVLKPGKSQSNATSAIECAESNDNNNTTESSQLLSKDSLKAVAESTCKSSNVSTFARRRKMKTAPNVKGPARQKKVDDTSKPSSSADSSRASTPVTSSASESFMIKDLGKSTIEKSPSNQRDLPFSTFSPTVTETSEKTQGTKSNFSEMESDSTGSSKQNIHEDISSTGGSPSPKIAPITKETEIVVSRSASPADGSTVIQSVDHLDTLPAGASFIDFQVKLDVEKTAINTIDKNEGKGPSRFSADCLTASSGESDIEVIDLDNRDSSSGDLDSSPEKVRTQKRQANRKRKFSNVKQVDGHSSEAYDSDSTQDDEEGIELFSSETSLSQRSSSPEKIIILEDKSASSAESCGQILSTVRQSAIATSSECEWEKLSDMKNKNNCLHNKSSDLESPHGGYIIKAVEGIDGQVTYVVKTMGSRI